MSEAEEGLNTDEKRRTAFTSGHTLVASTSRRDPPQK